MDTVSDDCYTDDGIQYAIASLGKPIPGGD